MSMTLKVLGAGTVWVSGIHSAVEVAEGTVRLPKGRPTHSTNTDFMPRATAPESPTADPDSDEATWIKSYVRDIGSRSWSGVLLHEDQEHLVAVELDRDDAGERVQQIWIVPAGFTYLLGEQGQTLDRL